MQIKFNKYNKQMFEKPKQTPFKTQQYRSLQHSKQIFVYYCGKGSKYNYQELQEKYFMQLVTELFFVAGKKDQISRRQKKWVQIATLYYTKGRKNPLNFNSLLELLPALSKCIFFDQNSPKKSTEYELEEERAMKNLLVLFDKVHLHISDEELYRKGIKSEQIQQQTKQFLLKLKDSLTKLYKIYFEYETNLTVREKDYHNKSFECFLELMKDFEVYPKLISAAQLHFVYNQVINQRQHNHLVLLSPSLYTRNAFSKYGEYFTLSRFVQSLILVSHVCIGKLKRVQGQDQLYHNMKITQKQAVKVLLEYMETMRSIKDKYCKFSKERFSLIVYEQYSDYISKTKREESYKSSPQKSSQQFSGETTKRSFYQILNKIKI